MSQSSHICLTVRELLMLQIWRTLDGGEVLVLQIWGALGGGEVGGHRGLGTKGEHREPGGCPRGLTQLFDLWGNQGDNNIGNRGRMRESGSLGYSRPHEYGEWLVNIGYQEPLS